ncbi:MAG: hypothetical protein JWQ78_1499 [Sediminibacterium sp.]|nr:hypothetical protein [Sediminibacterium sp.]
MDQHHGVTRAFHFITDPCTVGRFVKMHAIGLRIGGKGKRAEDQPNKQAGAKQLNGFHGRRLIVT